MSSFLKNGKKPTNKREKNIIRVLTRLRDGEPIESFDEFGILRFPAELNDLVLKWVNDSRETGCSCATKTFWFQAPRGGGKTETLRSIQRSLVDQGYSQDYGKSIVIPINLLDANTKEPVGLQISIFRSALLTKTSALHSDLQDAVARLIKGGGLNDPAAARGASLALDVITTVAGKSLPGLGTLLGEGIIPRLRRAFRLRRRNIEKILKKNGIGTPEALNLIASWIDFSVRPNKKRYDAFFALASEAASRYGLFHLFCRTLEQAGYTTIILLVDETDSLIENDAMVQAFESIWNRPAAGADFEHNIDVGFVMAITADPSILMNQGRYGGFVRRFFGPSGHRCKLVQTPRPEVSDDDSSSDDLARAIELYQNLLSQVANGIRVVPTGRDVSELRAVLHDKYTNYNLTWHDLWSSVARLFTS